MIKLIDCTLRDGGYINNFEFGQNSIIGIINNLINSKVDIIEAGFLRNDEFQNSKTVYSLVSEFKEFYKDCESEFALMLQQDQYNVNRLEPCDGTVKHIRCAFHHYDIKEGLKLCINVKNKGYKCHVNPINLLCYSKKELMYLIEAVNDINPDTFTIVDTLGCMQEKDLTEILNIVSSNLRQKISIGLHLHEHLSLSYSLAQTFLNLISNSRNISVDASLNGMGRIPGNLCIELIMYYLNKNYKKNYDLTYVYDAIDDYIMPIKKYNNWGYSLPYALSAEYKIHRTYVEFLLSKNMLKTRDIQKILSLIELKERSVYNKEYINNLYNKYISEKYLNQLI